MGISEQLLGAKTLGQEGQKVPLGTIQASAFADPMYKERSSLGACGH